MLYSTFKYPCIDRYPVGKEFVTDDTIQKIANQTIQAKGLQGKLKSTNVYTKLKAAFKVSAIWDPVKNPVLKIFFLDGTEKQKNWVKHMVNKDIVPIITKLTLDWNSTLHDSMIRISFTLPGQAWSYVGTDCLTIPSPQATMNLGWLDDDETYNSSDKHKNTGQVVLHEFLHMLGMIHEHTNPKNNPITWNRDVVYAELKRTNGWSPEQVDHNMFEKYGDAEACEVAKNLPKGPIQDETVKNVCDGTLVNGSEYDITSIMHYWYPPSWILKGPTEIPVNLTLSSLDKQWLSRYYGNYKEEEETTTEPIPKTQFEHIENALRLLKSLLKDNSYDTETTDTLLEIKTNIEAADCMCDTSYDEGDIHFGKYIMFFLLFLILVFIVIALFSTKKSTPNVVSKKSIPNVVSKKSTPAKS